MKLVAIADTHIKYGFARDNLPAGLIRLLERADMTIHAGDFVTREVFDELSGISSLEAVYGNMDEPALKNLLPERKVINIDGKKIGIIHEASLSLQDMTGARYMAKEMGADVLVFGHIHKPVIEKTDVLLICPGSPTSPRLSDPSAVELSIEESGITGRIVTLEGTKCGAVESARSFRKYMNQY